jgi:small subunit ribosomal protein S21
MGVTLVIVDCKNQDINKALKEFKRKVIKSGHIQELRDRKEYKKPTTIKREQTQKAIRKEKYNKNLPSVSNPQK